MVYESYSEKDTLQIASTLAMNAVRGGIYMLSGELGAGKTVFVKGFAVGLGINETITSPTFTIFKEYHSGRLPMYHMDAYRITNIAEMDDTGYEDYFFGDGICLIEWAELIGGLIPSGGAGAENIVSIKIEKDAEGSDDYRKITIIETTIVV